MFVIACSVSSPRMSSPSALRRDATATFSKTLRATFTCSISGHNHAQLVAVLGGVFSKDSRSIGIAVVLVVPYLLLNTVSSGAES